MLGNNNEPKKRVTKMKMKGFRNPGVNKARYTKGEKPPAGLPARSLFREKVAIGTFLQNWVLKGSLL